jgi:ATP-binding cassette, subfamily C (CFTR/MRP), member 1
MQMREFARAVAVANSTAHPVHQPFCHSDEGWGPLSLLRYDFTPCFLDVGVSAVSLFGLLFGILTIWLLVTKESKQPTERNWHYYTKLVGVFDIVATLELIS